MTAMPLGSPGSAAMTGGTNAPVSEARASGRRLATHPLLTVRADSGSAAMPEVLQDARHLLSSEGVLADILRIREGCAVVRVRAGRERSPAGACETAKGLLEALPQVACAVPGTVMETTCADRGADACLFTLLWEHPGTSAEPAEATVTANGHGELGVMGPGGSVSPEGAVAEDRASAGTAAAPHDAPSADAGPLRAVASRIAPGHLEPAGATTEPAAPSMASGTPRLLRIHARPGPVEGIGHSPRRVGVPAWLGRRAWLLVLALVAGSAGGWFAGKHTATSYHAAATLVVQSGASRVGPGSANDAEALATTYAALIPKDQGLLQAAAARLGMTSAAVGKAVTASVEQGTSLVVLGFSAPTAQRAIAGATAMARTVTSVIPISPAVAAGSITVVSLPTAASQGGTLHRLGLPLGAAIGLLVGLILVMVAERTDPRIDDTRALAEGAKCPASAVPEGQTPALLVATEAETTLTVVPLSIGDTALAMALVRHFHLSWPPPGEGPAVAVSPAFASGAVELARGSGPTVLVLRAGTRLRELSLAAERLRAIDRGPIWAVLVGRGRRAIAPDGP